jgi:Acetyltransferase (GNAT) domain
MTGAAVISPAPRDAWLEAYRADPNAMLYHSPDWIDLLCATRGYEDCSRLYELNGGRVVILPMVRDRTIGGFRREASLPLGWGMGGLLAPGGVCPSDVTAVLAELGSRRVPQISLRPDPLTGQAWAAARPRRVVTVPRLAHILDLEGGFEHVWKKRFTAVGRTGVRKAERSRLEVECDTEGRLLPVHYRLFERSLDRWAAQQHEPRWLARWRGHRRDPLPRLTATAKWLHTACRLWVAWLDGEPAASILVFQGPNANVARGAMDKALAGPTRANYLLHRLAIEEACTAGCRYYHMGESGASQPLAQFKTRFGACPYPSAEYHLETVPITSADRAVRSAVKRAIGFTDAPPAQPRPGHETRNGRG